MELVQFRARRGALFILFNLCCALLLSLTTLAQETGGESGAGEAAPAPTPTEDTGDIVAEDVGGEESAEVTSPGRSQANLLSGSAIAVQAFHQLLPNDYIRIVVSAGDNFSYDRTVDAQGNISLPLVADGVNKPPLSVEGLTVFGVQQQLRQLYSVYYVSPTVDVALLAVGRAQVLIVYPAGQTSIRTIVNGQTLYDLLRSVLSKDLRYRHVYVVRGGYDFFRRMTRQQELALEVPALPLAEARASGLLQLDTGMGTRESLRLDDLLARPDMQTFAVNVAELLRGGEFASNIEMRAGDIIFLSYGPHEAGVVGKGPKLVLLSGAGSSGMYGLLPGETLADLLRLSGFIDLPGLNLRNVLIERRDAEGRLRRIVANIDPASSDLDLSKVQLAHRDTVRVLRYVEHVSVVGSVNTPGVFSANPSYKALDYITLAGGPARDAHLRFVKVIRQGRDVGKDRDEPFMFNIDLGKDLKGEAHEGYSIIPGDIIYVPPKGYEPSIRDVTSALSTMFLGINFFGDLNNPATVPVN